MWRTLVFFSLLSTIFAFIDYDGEPGEDSGCLDGAKNGIGLMGKGAAASEAAGTDEGAGDADGERSRGEGDPATAAEGGSGDTEVAGGWESSDDGGDTDEGNRPAIEDGGGGGGAEGSRPLGKGMAGLAWCC